LAFGVIDKVDGIWDKRDMGKPSRHKLLKQYKEPGPRLATLLASGVVWIEDGAYVGKATDEVVVNLGMVGFCEGPLEGYLEAYPGPSDW